MSAFSVGEIMALEDDAIQRAANEIEFALRKDDDDAKVRALDTIIQYHCNIAMTLNVRFWRIVLKKSFLADD
jgi:hypothetical protein